MAAPNDQTSNDHSRFQDVLLLIGSLQPSSSSTTLSPGGITGSGGNIFDSTNLHTGTSQTTESGLGTRTRLLGSGSTSGSELLRGGDNRMSIKNIGKPAMRACYACPNGSSSIAHLPLPATTQRSLRSTNLDVQSRDTDFLALLGNILSGQHGSVRRRLVSIGLDLHSTGDSGDGFFTREIGNVDESIVEGGEDLRVWQGIIRVMSIECCKSQ